MRFYVTYSSFISYTCHFLLLVTLAAKFQVLEQSYSSLVSFSLLLLLLECVLLITPSLSRILICFFTQLPIMA